MQPEDLTQQIHALDAVPEQRSGADRLRKQVRLIDLKAAVAGRGARELEHILAAVPAETLSAIRRDVAQARAGHPDGEITSDDAFERAVSSIERLMRVAH